MTTRMTPECAPLVRRPTNWLESYHRLQAFGDANPNLFRYPTNFTRQGVCLPRDTLIENVEIECPSQHLPDVVVAGEIAVSAKLREVIENVEPGVHQFHRLPVTCLKGERATVDYYILIAGNGAVLDQVDLEASTIARKTSGGLSKIIPPMRSDNDKIVINRIATAWWHLWWSWDIYNYLTISDEMKAAIEAAGIECLEFISMRESDRSAA